jgi:hypothetical protein
MILLWSNIWVIIPRQYKYYVVRTMKQNYLPNKTFNILFNKVHSSQNSIHHIIYQIFNKFLNFDDVDCTQHVVSIPQLSVVSGGRNLCDEDYRQSVDQLHRAE